MTMTIRLEDSTFVEIENTAITKQADRWFRGQLESAEVPNEIFLQSLEERMTGNWVIVRRGEPQSQDEQLAGIYYPCAPVPTGPTIVMQKNIAFGDVVIGGGVVFSNDADVGSNVAFATVTPVTCDVVFDSNTISGSSHLVRSLIHPTVVHGRSSAVDPEIYLRNLGTPLIRGDISRQVLSAFTSYAKEILKLKGIAITETRIRKWQAIEDTSWKQCILDLTVKAESHIALSIWDELTEELQKFISRQPEIDRPFLEDNLSVDVKWV